MRRADFGVRPKIRESENLKVSPGGRARERPGVASFGASREQRCRGRKRSRGGRSGGLWLVAGRPRRSYVESRADHDGTRREVPLPGAREAHMKYSSASGASEPTSETQKFFFAVLRSGHSGEDRKIDRNHPTHSTTRRRSRWSIDFGAPGWLEGSSQIVWSAAELQNFRNSDSPKTDAQISELGVCCRPRPCKNST